MLAKETFQPFAIKMNDDRTDPVSRLGNAWSPHAYAMTVVVAVPERESTLLNIESIEAVQLEHDVSASGNDAFRPERAGRNERSAP